MTETLLKNYNGLLKNIANELDISPSKYKVAVERYQAVGKWLSEGEYADCEIPPFIYPQGSFRLGTVTRPWRENKEANYDIDLVCQLPLEKNNTTPEDVKQMVGKRLNENGNYERMLNKKEGKRCWTLNYAEADNIGFHMDILPSTPEDETIINDLIGEGVSKELAEKTIAITNKNKQYYTSLSSNPSGYADWFDSVKQPVFDLIVRDQKEMIFKSNLSLFAQIDEVPDQLVKTPLQTAIQILKRHRDISFSGHPDEDYKPISMIITTLAARFYNNEPDVYTTLKSIIEQLRTQSQLLEPGFIFESAENNLPFMQKSVDGAWYIPNPVNPAENFADRWHEDNHKRARAFFKWVSWVYQDLVNVFNKSDIREIGSSLEGIFGGRLIENASKGIYVTGAPSIIPSTQRERHHVEIKNPAKPYGLNHK